MTAYEPRHRLAPRTRRAAPRPAWKAPAWLLTVLGLLALEPDTFRAAFRDLGSRWRMSRPQTPAQADQDATETLRWLGRAHPACGCVVTPQQLRPIPVIARMRASTLVVGWIAEQTRPGVPDLVLWFRLWCLSEGIA